MPEDTRTPAERAYAVWYRLTNPVATPTPPWPLLEPATRALWEQIAQAVLRDKDCPHA